MNGTSELLNEYSSATINRLKVKCNRPLMACSISTSALISLAATSTTHGAIQYQTLDLTLNAGNPSSSINIGGGGADDIKFIWRSTTNRVGGISLLNSASASTTGANKVQNFSYGQTIGLGGNLTSSSGVMFLYNGGFDTAFQFDDAATGYLGLRYNDSGTKTAWIHIDSIATNGISYHISGYAYEDSGATIKAGEGAKFAQRETEKRKTEESKEQLIVCSTEEATIPEPSGLALLACGAAGIYALRRQKRR